MTAGRAGRSMGAVLTAHDSLARASQAQRPASCPTPPLSARSPLLSQSKRQRCRPCVPVEATRQWDTGCRLAGCGSSVPSSVLTNADLEKLVETNDDWIAARTGIRCVTGLHSSAREVCLREVLRT